MTTKCFAYCRVSGASQVGGDGFERQGISILKHAEANGLEVVAWFEEGGVSGKTEWESRPAWVKMMESLNGVRTIIIERLDRLARDLMVQEHILADLKRRDITLISAAEPDLGSEDPTRVLLRQIMGAVGQYDRTMIVLKLRGARERKKRDTGRCEGRKPFGYYPGEQHALKRIAELAAKPVSKAQITRTLNEEGIPTRDGNQWKTMVVGRIVDRLEVK